MNRKISTVLLVSVLCFTLLFASGCHISSVDGGETTDARPLHPQETLSPSTPLPPQSEGAASSPIDSEPIATQPGLTEEPDTDAPETDAPVSETDSSTDSPETQDPDTVRTLVLEDGVCEWEIESSSGTKLNLHAVCEASENEDGELLVSVNLFLSHRAISCSERTGCMIRIGSEKKTFTAPEVRQEEQDATMTYLVSMDAEAAPDTPFTIEASFPFRGVYGGVSIETLTLKNTVCIEKSE